METSQRSRIHIRYVRGTNNKHDAKRDRIEEHDPERLDVRADNVWYYRLDDGVCHPGYRVVDVSLCFCCIQERWE